jgi:hypothetical protein
MELTPRSIALYAVRYVLPALVCLAGVLVLAFGSPALRLDAFVVLVAAGLSTLMFNKLVRIGIVGDHERDEEEAARVFLDRYRMWPDEVPEGWQPPDGEPDAETALRHILERQAGGMVAA